MKKFIALAAVALVAFSAAPAKADSISFSYFGGYPAYTYVAPPPVAYYPSYGVTYVQPRVVYPTVYPVRRVVRPPVFASWQFRDNDHGRGNGHDWHDNRGHDNRGHH